MFWIFIYFCVWFTLVECLLQNEQQYFVGHIDLFCFSNFHITFSVIIQPFFPIFSRNWNLLELSSCALFFITFQQIETFQCSLDFNTNILIHWIFFQCICLPIFHFSLITWVIISKQNLWRQRTKICIIWWLKSMNKYLISSIFEYFSQCMQCFF